MPRRMLSSAKPGWIDLNPMASSASSALPPRAASQPKRLRISTSGVGPSWNMYERLCTCDKKARTWLGSFVHSQCDYIYIPCSWDSLLTQPDPWSSFQAPAPGWRPDLPAPAPVANLQGDAAGRLEGKSATGKLATGKLATGKWSFIIIWYNRQGYTCIIIY